MPLWRVQFIFTGIVTDLPCYPVVALGNTGVLWFSHCLFLSVAFVRVATLAPTVLQGVMWVLNKGLMSSSLFSQFASKTWKRVSCFLLAFPQEERLRLHCKVTGGFCLLFLYNLSEPYVGLRLAIVFAVGMLGLQKLILVAFLCNNKDDFK